MRPAARAVLFGGSLAASLAVAVFVFRGGTSHWLAAAWFLSLFPFTLATRLRRPRRTEGASASASAPAPARALLLLAVAALPVLVRVANFDSNRMHTDEFMTAYFSATHDFSHSKLLDHADAARPGFFGYMPEKWDWQGQFPKLFFFLQRVFFTLFGESLLTVRLSVQIYVALVSVMLFLIVREILDQKAALIAVVVYSFLAVSVYLETLGLHFISSTAIFTAFFFLALREFRTGEMFHAGLAGMACGFCYLTYYSSYLAFPMLLVFVAIHFLRARSWLVLQNFAIALAGILLVLAPFLAYGLRYGNYIWKRTNQVSLLTGEWSPYREAIASGERKPLSVIGENLALSLRSFVQDGYGGHGGYDFGRLAFFDRFSLALLLLGILAGLVLLVRKVDLLFVFLAIGASFLSGMVLTIPPPAYHRFSIAFPFLVVLMTLPFSLLLRIRPLPMSIRYALAGGLLLVFACVNQGRFVQAVFLDAPGDELRLARFLDQRYPGRNLYLAAYGGFGFEKILYFAMKNRPPKIRTDYHENLLKVFNRNEKYVYVILFPGDFNSKFRDADPNGRLFQFSGRLSVFAN